MNEELIQSYASGELVALVGADLSATAGLPSRRGLAERLLDVARDFGHPPAALEEFEELLAEGELLELFSDIIALLPERTIRRTIERAFDDAGRQPPALAHALAELSALRGVITTNLDRLLERAFTGRWPCYARPLASFPQTRGWIYKLHGDLSERETWILTRDDYRRVMYNDPAHQALAQTLFLATPLLIVGCSFEDPDFMAVVDRIAALAPAQLPKHFALLDDSLLDARRRRRLAEVGVQTIGYANPDGTHAERIRLLQELARSVGPSA